MLLCIYRVIIYMIQPIIWLHLLLRSRKNPAYRKRWRERYGFCAGKIVPDCILIHAVSVGEIIAAIPLVKALRHQYPCLPITVTTMTPTGSDCVQSTLGKYVYHVYLPYDLPGAIKRFLEHVNPKIVIIMETELWPNLIYALYKRQTPLFIANARLSPHSAAGYKKIGVFVRDMLGCITLIAAQSSDDAERFLALGLKQSRLAVIGSLKFETAITPELVAHALTLRGQWAPHRPVWITASTHDGEERILLFAQRKLLEKYPDLLLILVPRHPERFVIVKDMVQKAGFSYILRSGGDIPSIRTQVVIGDTMGELMLLYGIADLAFIGGTLVKCGGHNPLEPAAHAIPVLMGPHTFNFSDICAKMSQAAGLITVFGADSLVNEVGILIKDKKRRIDYGSQALKFLYQNQGASQRLLQLLEPYLSLI